MACGADFDSWLSEKLQTLNTDETVFGPYIKSVVEGDESREEKVDAIDGLLGELLPDGTLDVETFREEILSRWKSECENRKGVDVNGTHDSTDLDTKLADILKINDELAMAENKSKLFADKSKMDALDKASKNLTPASDSALRAAILNQYKDDTDSDSGGEKEKSGSSKTAGNRSGASGGGGDLGLEKNTNSERVMNDMKDRRDREKADAAKKREKDREDRAKQKQLQQDRKEKAKKKATKVERKR